MKIIIAVATLIFATTNISLGQIEKDKNKTTYKLAKMIDIIEQLYVDSTNSAELVDVAIKAMLEKLDPHSAYIAAKRVEAVGKVITGVGKVMATTVDRYKSFSLFASTLICQHHLRQYLRR